MTTEMNSDHLVKVDSLILSLGRLQFEVDMEILM